MFISNGGFVLSTRRLQSVYAVFSVVALLVVLALSASCKASSGVSTDAVESPNSADSADSATDSTAVENASEVGSDDATTDRMRYLALGDSYTIGTRIEQANNFPNQLVDRLRTSGLTVGDPVNIAQNGWTTEDLALGMDRRNPQGPFGLVTLLIGVNNQFQGESVDAFRPQFVERLDAAISLAGGDPNRVVVVSIPDYSVTPFGQQRDPDQVAEDLERFNQVCQTQAEQAGSRYVNITPLSRRAANDPTLLASDGLHPSAKMYGLWVDLLVPVAQEALER
jgi:lysophospholipase L1-like esterase